MSPRISREESQQQTRQRLLDAAFTVFGERGYHGSSIDAIADEAGFSKGAVYSNFASKDELFLALLDHYAEEQMKGWERIRNLFESNAQSSQNESDYVEYIQQQRLWILLQMEFMLNALRDEKMREEVAKRLRAMREVMKNHLAAAHELHGITPALPLDQLPLSLFSFDIGLAMQTLLDPEIIPNDLYNSAARRLLG